MTRRADIQGWRAVARANLGRAITVSVIVGTLLVLLNHGDHVVMDLTLEPVCDHFYLKACGSYAIPFLVSLVSAILAARDLPRR